MYKNVANFTSTNWKYELLLKYSPKLWLFKINAFLFVPKTIVTSIDSNYSRIAYAGFNNVSMNLVEDAPIGVIYGTSFLRDENQNLIIDNQGYPIANNEIKKIADPNPEWVMNVNYALGYNNFRFEISTEYKKGGQVWNGTKNYLNYYGVAQETAENRVINNYVFEGVTQNGNENTTHVSLDENWYQRYGASGIDELAVEDASWLRIPEISFSYVKYNKFSFKIWVQNLLIYTPYSGVDPQTALFGYSITQPLDLFNMPAVKSYGISFSLNF